jgi:AcrR family transcriptional regulator
MAPAMSIWARPEPAARKPRFSRDQIASAAVAIADAEGFDAVSMRRIAAALGAGTMSLYRYITTKSDLVALMDDALLGESLVPEGELPAGWRAAVAAVARRTRDMLMAHPWAIQSLHGEAAATGVPLGGPNSFLHFEQSLAALASAPLSTADKLNLLAMLDDYIFGHVLNAAEVRARHAAADQAGQDSSPVISYLNQQLSSGSFPHLQALAGDTEAASMAEAGKLDERFELGLAVLIDGACARLRTGSIDRKAHGG